MSMWELTATVTWIFSRRRSRPVLRWTSVREVERDVGDAADAQAAIVDRRIGRQPLHVAREQDHVVGVGPLVTRAQLPDHETDGRGDEQHHRRTDQHIGCAFFHATPFTPAGSPPGRAARGNSPDPGMIVCEHLFHRTHHDALVEQHGDRGRTRRGGYRGRASP